MLHPVIDATNYARRAIQKVLGKPLLNESMTAFEARLLAAVSHEIERAIIFERQGGIQIVANAIDQARLMEKAPFEKDRPTLVETLEEVKKKLDLRTAATPEMVERLSAMLQRSFENVPENGGLPGLNALGKTSYADFAEAARELVLGQAPCALEDDVRVWSALVDVKIYRYA